MKIIFKKVTIRNFLSFGNVPTEFEYGSGINIVTGRNLDNGTRNGVGKCLKKDTEIEIECSDDIKKLLEEM